MHEKTYFPSFLGHFLTFAQKYTYIHQNFLKVFVHVIIIDQCNQTAH